MEQTKNANAELIERFFRDARAVALGEKADIDFSPEALVSIASTSSLRMSFVEKFNAHINDPDLKIIIVDYVEETADALEGHIDTTDAVIELIDRASLPIATTAILSGIGLFVSVGIVIGPMVIFGGGLAGLAISGTGRTVLRLRANRSKAAIKKLRKFASRLRGL